MSERVPDSDTIKMFMGQISKNLDEESLKDYLKDFGEVYEAKIIRDKVTSESRGCAFVTFYTRKDALTAQMALHNLVTMPGVSNPIQMTPADGAHKTSLEERRLFLGKIPRSITEQEIHSVFSRFGEIEDMYIIREPNEPKICKGCAFVTYTSKDAATEAIKQLHMTRVFEAFDELTIVKFADTQKEKERKKMMNNAKNIPVMGPTPHIPPPNPLAALSTLQANAQNAQLQQFLLAALATSPLIQGNSAISSLFGAQPTNNYPNYNNNYNPNNNINSANLNNNINPNINNNINPNMNNNVNNNMNNNAINNTINSNASINNQNLNNTNHVMAGIMNQIHNTNNSNYSTNQNLNPVVNNNPIPTHNPNNMLASHPPTPVPALSNNSLSNSLAAFSHYQSSSFQQSMAQGLTNSNAMMSMLGQSYSSDILNSYGLQNAFATYNQDGGQSYAPPSGQQSKGPEGANLFIYHLPIDYRDEDLYHMFNPFGKVLSATVFMDKKKNESKCFGFVSYDSPASAEMAIRSMNGFQVGSKRLKVSLKTNTPKPY